MVAFGRIDAVFLAPKERGLKMEDNTAIALPETNSSDNAIEIVMESTKNILRVAATLIYDALAEEDNIGITDLSKAIAAQLELKQTLVYGVIGAYVDFNQELVIALGKGGGIWYRHKYEALQLARQEIKEAKTLSKFSSTARELGFQEEQFKRAKKELLTDTPTIKALKEWIAKQ
jgi:hypothetical protein